MARAGDIHDDRTGVDSELAVSIFGEAINVVAAAGKMHGPLDREVADQAVASGRWRATSGCEAKVSGRTTIATRRGSGAVGAAGYAGAVPGTIVQRLTSGRRSGCGRLRIRVDNLLGQFDQSSGDMPTAIGPGGHIAAGAGADSCARGEETTVDGGGVAIFGEIAIRADVAAPVHKYGHATAQGKIGRVIAGGAAATSEIQGAAAVSGCKGGIDKNWGNLFFQDCGYLLERGTHAISRSVGSDLPCLHSLIGGCAVGENLSLAQKLGITAVVKGGAAGG